jgi:thioredoxin-related protein
MFAQTFYVLTGVKKYDPLVSSVPELEIHNEEILEEMRDMSKELKINTANHPSRVLAFIISKFSVGDTVGYKIDLELGEYMKRDSDNGAIFALSYIDTHMIKASDDVEDDLMDAVEDMLSKFAHQYNDDNKNKSETTSGLTHENFSLQMGYETDYEKALLRAKKEGKALFIFMSTSYCPWCRKLEKRMLSKVEIDKKIKAKYIPLMLNFSKKDFPKQFKEIALTPTLYIVDPKTEKIKQQFVGYSARDEFLHLLKK